MLNLTQYVELQAVILSITLLLSVFIILLISKHVMDFIIKRIREHTINEALKSDTNSFATSKEMVSYASEVNRSLSCLDNEVSGAFQINKKKNVHTCSGSG